MPNVCFTTDVIVGFPQETEEDFKESAEFIKKAKFLMVHVFPYSQRKGTEAAKMNGQIDSAEKTRRLHELEEIEKNCRNELLNDLIKKEPQKKILFETFDGKYAHGHTDNFLEVAVPSSRDLRGEILSVSITETDGNICFGNIIDNR
jgi:threonylcarbamoyladenosine tRNA methylthiotransferase MtaB